MRNMDDEDQLIKGTHYKHSRHFFDTTTEDSESGHANTTNAVEYKDYKEESTQQNTSELIYSIEVDVGHGNLFLCSVMLFN